MMASVARRAVGDYVIPAVTLAGALAAWEAASRIFHIPSFIMPAPSAILSEG